MTECETNIEELKLVVNSEWENDALLVNGKLRGLYTIGKVNHNYLKFEELLGVRKIAVLIQQYNDTEPQYKELVFSVLQDYFDISEDDCVMGDSINISFFKAWLKTRARELK